MKLKYESILVEPGMCPGKRYKEYRKVGKMKNAIARAGRLAGLLEAKAQRDRLRPPELVADFNEDMEMSLRVRATLRTDWLL